MIQSIRFLSTIGISKLLEEFHIVKLFNTFNIISYFCTTTTIYFSMINHSPRRECFTSVNTENFSSTINKIWNIKETNIPTSNHVWSLIRVRPEVEEFSEETRFVSTPIVAHRLNESILIIKVAITPDVI